MAPMKPLISSWDTIRRPMRGTAAITTPTPCKTFGASVGAGACASPGAEVRRLERKNFSFPRVLAASLDHDAAQRATRAFGTRGGNRAVALGIDQVEAGQRGLLLAHRIIECAAGGRRLRPAVAVILDCGPENFRIEHRHLALIVFRLEILRMCGVPGIVERHSVGAPVIFVHDSRVVASRVDAL